MTEVQRPELGDVWTWPFFALLAVTVLLLIRSWRPLDAVTLLPILGTAALAVQYVRSVPFFVIAAAPFVSEAGSAWWTTRRPEAAPLSVTPEERRRLRAAVALLVAAVVITTPFRITGPRVEQTEAEMFPVAATEWLNANRPPGELFNVFDWGGYLILHAPEYRVSIDGRADVYDDYLDTAIATVQAEPGWEDELDREGIGTALLPTGVPLAEALATDPGWRTAYQDDVATVFVRR